MTEEIVEKKALINGEWVESESGERFEVHYPGDGRVVGTVPRCTRKDVQRAVAAARQGQQALAKLSLLKRIELLHKAVEIAGKSDAEAARILCMETGKPLQQSISEASPINGYSWSNFHVATANVKSHRGLTLPNVTEDSNNKRIMHIFEPVGVVANISTFSYPSEMPNCTIPYALALGNSVIVKPSSGSPFSAILIAEALHEAGFPPGSINVLTGPGAVVGDELVSSPGVDAVNFFGQEKTGEAIAAKAALKKLLFAIVSNNALIVMDDANIEEAVNAAIGGCYSHNGQSPISTRRILVHKEVHKQFVDLFVERTKCLVFGDPLDPNTDVGPVNNATVLEMTMTLVEDARQKGARLLAGGNNTKGLYIEPTVIDAATKDMAIAQEVTMGPVTAVMTFGSIDEAVEMANSTRFGFQFGAFTSGLANAYYLAENIKAGSIYINEATSCWDEMAPFGGVKRSGVGRMLSDWIFNELSEIKMIMFDLSKVKKQ
jgi:acyl-CoA reductase-like NAD-dependent aldehyde dehydrogenase